LLGLDIPARESSELAVNPILNASTALNLLAFFAIAIRWLEAAGQQTCAHAAVLPLSVSVWGDVDFSSGPIVCSVVAVDETSFVTFVLVLDILRPISCFRILHRAGPNPVYASIAIDLSHGFLLLAVPGTGKGLPLKRNRIQ
jgi:hypothetical protein